MPSFNGPWSKDLDSFKKSLQSMPEKYKASFTSASTATLEKTCDPDVLHVWESDSDIDSLLQLTFVVAKLCDLGARKEKGANANNGSMVIIAEEKGERDNFRRICQLLQYLTCSNGKKQLEGTVAAFGKLVVVRGWPNLRHPTASGNKEAAEKVVKRINIAVERVFKKGGFEGRKRRIVWHHGPVIHFFLHFINTTTSSLRSAISAVTVTGSLDFRKRVAPSNAGRANTLPDLELLESYARKLDIPVVFLDSPTQLITTGYLNGYVYYYAYYINTFLPSTLSSPHLHKALDELVTFAFRLRAASEDRYGSEAVKMVQKHLDASKAKHWAKRCVSKDSYEKKKCLAAGRDEAIHHAVQLADSPFTLLSYGDGLPAFARLAVGPATTATTDCYTAAPVNINFKQAQLRASSPAPFHILIPAASQDFEKVTNRVQGLMMAVLARVRQEKGNQHLGDTADAVRETWKAVVKACTWAIDGCAGKMPKGVDEKVKFVQGKLKEGTWSLVLGTADTKNLNAGAGHTGTGTGAAIAGPNRTYGFGMGPGAGQTMGVYPHTALPQNPGIGAGIPNGVDPSLYPQVPTQPYTQGTPAQGYTQRPLHTGYAPVQQDAAYEQSMGGPW